MKHPVDTPFGFEDGSMVSYECKAYTMLLRYEFWNARHGLFIFDEYVGCYDAGAIGQEASGASQVSDSPLLTVILQRKYVIVPNPSPWFAIQFYDLEGEVMLEIVCGRYRFSGDD